jgi:transcriptional regulator with XRE-family HTH domain
MERQFRLNWPAIVEEAKQRRKAQNLTQQRLAMLANVSAPTISRFESGSKDIELSSILNILKMLGMVDQRHLIFPDKFNVQYDHIGNTVIFWGQDGTKSIRCAIAKDALSNHYKSKSKEPIKIFLEHHSAIEHEAVRKYLNNQFETNDYILIKTEDLAPF